MRSCKAAVFPKAANRLLDYLLLYSNSNTFTSVTKLLAFLNSHFYLSHHLRSPSAVYLKYIELSSIFLWDVLKFHLGWTLFFILFYSWLVYLEVKLHSARHTWVLLQCLRQCVSNKKDDPLLELLVTILISNHEGVKSTFEMWIFDLWSSQGTAKEHVTWSSHHEFPAGNTDFPSRILCNIFS